MDDSTKGAAEMDEGFAEFAARKGVSPKMFYTVPEVSDILGVPESTMRDEIKAGRIKYHLPPGRRLPKLIAPAWVDEWIKAGCHA